MNPLNMIIFNDAPEPFTYGFQDSATNLMDGISKLHNEVTFYIIILLVMVSYLLLISLIDRKNYK